MDYKDAGLPWYVVLSGILAAPSGVGQIKMVEVEDTGDFFDCNHRNMSHEGWFKSLIGLNGEGEPAIRVSINSSVTSGNPIMDCNTKAVNWFQLAKKVTGKDSEGNPCLRLMIDAL